MKRGKNMEKSTKKMVITALMTAFTCIATMILKWPMPTLGYIHIGDGMVLLSGIVLGPMMGMFSAGIGSMLADLFSGYISFAPATFIIKALTAGVSGFLFHKLKHYVKSTYVCNIVIVISGVIGESIMVIGYFLYETGMAAFASGGFSTAALAAGAVSSAIGIPFNIIQGVVGIFICLLVLPILLKISDIRDWILL